MKLTPLPTRKAWQALDTSSPLVLASRIIEGHPDDIETIRKELLIEHRRHALCDLIDGHPEDESPEDILGPRAVKIISALYAAKAETFNDRFILQFPPVSTHARIFREAGSKHAQMALIAMEPSLEALLVRPWDEPFYGHDHTPSLWRKLKSFAQNLSRRGTPQSR
jgi:hypothetical protein